MSKFKVGDLVRVIDEAGHRYIYEIDIIEFIQLYKRSMHYYLKNCHIKNTNGKRLFFYESELELVKSQDFTWIKKSINV